ncbi:unnamed protein product, partial [marine sediment metagenome]
MDTLNTIEFLEVGGAGEYRGVKAWDFDSDR